MNYPLSDIQKIISIIDDTLDNSQKRFKRWQLDKNSTFHWNSIVINEFIDIYTIQKKDCYINLKQCEIWRQEELDELQETQIQYIKDNTLKLIEVTDQILFFLKNLKFKGFGQVN